MITDGLRLAWLTPRERVVLTHLMRGHTVEQIAAVEYVNVCTVRSHVRSILMKLGVRTQLAAVAMAYRDETLHSLAVAS